MVRSSAAKPSSTKPAAPVKTRATAVAKPKKAAPKKIVPKPAAVPAKGSVKPAKAAAVVKKAPVLPSPSADKPVKVKHKLVRDSFTMPKVDFDLIAVLKDRALGFRQPVKKSELLRAGLRVLSGLPDDTLKATLGTLEALKPGRPKATGE
ncbi:MAG: hypothetical protein ABI605_03745 [Rhizobacter sp.]